MVTKYPAEVYINLPYGTAVIYAVIGLSILAIYFIKKILNRNYNSSTSLYMPLIITLLAFFMFTSTTNFVTAMLFFFVGMIFFNCLKVAIEEILISVTDQKNAGKYFSFFYIVEEIVLTIAIVIYAYLADGLTLFTVGQLISVVTLLLLVPIAIKTGISPSTNPDSRKDSANYI